MERKFDFRLFSSIICLVCLTLSPLPIFGRRTLNLWIDKVFSQPTRRIRQTMFPNQSDFEGFYTDSPNYLILISFGFVISFIAFFLVSTLIKNYSVHIHKFINTTLIYYIAWVFMVYGFSKLHGHQFPDLSYLNLVDSPENRDIQFWKWLGNNPNIVYLIGLVEIAVAVGLLFSKTRKVSLKIFTSIMFGIVAVNWYFGIGVLVFSWILLITAIVCYLNTKKIEPWNKSIPESFYKPIKLFAILCVVIFGWFYYL